MVVGAPCNQYEWGHVKSEKGWSTARRQRPGQTASSVHAPVITPKPLTPLNRTLVVTTVLTALIVAFVFWLDARALQPAFVRFLRRLICRSRSHGNRSYPLQKYPRLKSD